MLQIGVYSKKENVFTAIRERFCLNYPSKYHLQPLNMATRVEHLVPWVEYEIIPIIVVRKVTIGQNKLLKNNNKIFSLL